MSKNLSKSKYLSGLQCEKRLWLEINDSGKSSETSEYQQRLFDQGNEVGIMARSYFIDGYLIDTVRSNIYHCIEETHYAIDRGESIIFEGTFFYDNTFVMADIIRKNEDESWDVIEVKSAIRIKDEYIPDLAVQRYVLEGSGLRINKTCTMYINRECVYPDLSNLFVIKDVSDKVENIIHEVSVNITRFKNIVKLENEPEILIGPHCNKPYACPFIEYCWQNVGNRTVFDIPLVEELPNDHSLTDSQSTFINRMLNEQVKIDYDGIKRKLSELEYPIHFLDFETDSSAIPRLIGTSPFDKIPFQYSCHVMHENGDIEHFEYIHLDQTDPRLPLTESLVNCIRKNGSIIAYNASFERQVLTNLAKSFPEHSGYLNSITNRLWDQLDIFKRYYKHPDFANSNSLKSVLPVLIPELSYEELAIGDGNQAQSVWNLMIRTENEADKNQMIRDLKAYCKMDTLAMVEIQKLLLKLGGNK